MFITVGPMKKLYIGYRGLAQGSPHPNCFHLYFRRWLRPGPSSSLQTTPESQVLSAFRVGSSICLLLGLDPGPGP